MKRYDLLTPRESGEGNDKKVYWTKCGSMWPLKDKDGFSIQLDSLPVNGRLVAMVPKERDGGKGGI